MRSWRIKATVSVAPQSSMILPSSKRLIVMLVRRTARALWVPCNVQREDDAAVFADLLLNHESQVGEQLPIERHRPSHTFEAMERHRVDVIHEIRAVVVAGGRQTLARADVDDSLASQRGKLHWLIMQRRRARLVL
jgi:hypothetical protein